MNTSKQNQPSELKTSVVGVDLGAFSVKIAAVEKGVVDIITNQANLRQTPSIVGYGPKERLIGESGNVKLKSNLANTIISPQRYLSLQSEQQLSHESKFLPCKIRREEIENKFKVNCQGKEEMISPQQATAALFTKIQQIVQLNQIASKVITVAVPSDFTHQQKQALLDSFQISRKASKNNFSLQIVSQSTAVGLDYGYYKKHQFSEKEQQAKNVMFLDFGHSKLSLYIIKFTRNYQKVLYQKHINQLGCRDLDEIVLQFYSDLFEKQNPTLQVSVKESKKATFKLLQAIQRQRKVLTGISEYDFSIDCLLEECDISYTMKRQELENIISPALETIERFFREVLNDLKEKSINLSSIELIGGGSRIPIFIKMVSNIFGVDPSRTLNSSECVAKGTALYSAMNSGIFRMQPYYSVDLSPENVSINWKSNSQEFYDQSNKVVLIHEGEHIYSKKTVDFSVNTQKSNQLCFSLSNGHRGDICSFSIQLACEDQETSQKTIRLTAFFGSNGTIDNVDVREVKGDIEAQIHILNFSPFQHINQEKLKEFIKIQIQQIKVDQQIINFYERKNNFQSQIYDLKQKSLGFLSNKDIKEFINPKDHKQFMNYFENLENSLDQMVQFDNILKQVKQKMSIFYTSIQETKKSYESVDSQLQKFSQIIDSVLSGKIKKVKYYPKEETEEALQWIKQIKSLQKNKPKYEPHPTSLEEINKKIESFKASVDRVQEEMSMKQRQNSQRYFHPERSSEPSRHYDHSAYDPFGTAYPSRQYDPRYKRGRNQSFNGYNSGIFSGFPGFF